MDTKYFEAFIAAAERLNFSRAAKSLYITQPALSKQIAELESMLGAKLFSRTNRNVRLTREGAAVLPRVREILSLIDSLKDIVKTPPDSISEAVSLMIGIDDKLFRNLQFKLLVSQAVERMREKYPSLTINFLILEGKAVSEAIYSKKIDVGILMEYEEIADDQLNSNVFYTDYLSMVISAKSLGESGDKDLIEILARSQILLLSPNVKEQTQMLKLFSRYNISPSFIFVEDASVAFMRLYEGKGIFLMPKLLASEYLSNNVEVAELPPEDGELYYVINWKKENYNEYIQLFFELLAQEFGGES